MNCPGCGAAMAALDFERRLGGSSTLDFCFACQLIWFDPGESTALSPGAVLAIFKALDEHRADARSAPTGLMDCPRCHARLELTQDLQHATRFSYLRCPFGHGRLSPFMQFLREKNFIRPVSGAELAALKAKVKSVNCSNCGAPVDLEHEIACSYCHTPISILDPQAVADTVRQLKAAETARTTVDVNALADAILAVNTPPPSQSPLLARVQTVTTGDLVAAGIGLVAAMLRR